MNRDTTSQRNKNTTPLRYSTTHNPAYMYHLFHQTRKAHTHLWSLFCKRNATGGGGGGLFGAIVIDLASSELDYYFTTLAHNVVHVLLMQNICICCKCANTCVRDDFLYPQCICICVAVARLLGWSEGCVGMVFKFKEAPRARADRECIKWFVCFVVTWLHGI